VFFREVRFERLFNFEKAEHFPNDGERIALKIVVERNMNTLAGKEGEIATHLIEVETEVQRGKQFADAPGSGVDAGLNVPLE
jgi:hypothetical protein